jgi:hypothetical protein
VLVLLTASSIVTTVSLLLALSLAIVGGLAFVAMRSWDRDRRVLKVRVVALSGYGGARDRRL